MTYNTLNPVPSTDPRDLDDNSQAFDRFMMSSSQSEPDRLGVMRMTWSYVEAAATALTNQNVVALAGLTSADGKAFRFTGSSGQMATYDITSLGITLAGVADAAAARSAIGAAAVFTGSSDLGTDYTLTTTGVTAGTYAQVTVNAKGRVTGGVATLPVANGGTGATTAAAARTALSAASSGANSDITALSGLTTALSIAQGGTGASTASAARTGLAAAASGANSDITSITGLSTPLSTAQGGTGGIGAWTAATLANSWVISGGYRASYRKYLDVVQLEFGIVNGTATDATIITTLPAGFRPPNSILIPVVSAPSTALSTSVAVPRAVLASDGTIKVYNVTAAVGVYFSITFATV